MEWVLARFEFECMVIVVGSLVVLGEANGLQIQIDHDVHGISRFTGGHILRLLPVAIDFVSFLCGYGVMMGILSEKELALWVVPRVNADNTGAVRDGVELYSPAMDAFVVVLESLDTVCGVVPSLIGLGDDGAISCDVHAVLVRVFEVFLGGDHAES